MLGECGVSIFGTQPLARKYTKGFRFSLHGAPFLFPTEGTAARRGLDQWMNGVGIRPSVAGEFDDSALLKAFGQGGSGLFAAPSILSEELERQHHVKKLGVAESLVARFYLITAERRLKHPAVVAISEAAKNDVFALEPPQRPRRASKKG